MLDSSLAFLNQFNYYLNKDPIDSTLNCAVSFKSLINI